MKSVFLLQLLLEEAFIALSFLISVNQLLWEDLVPLQLLLTRKLHRGQQKWYLMPGLLQLPLKMIFKSFNSQYQKNYISFYTCTENTLERHHVPAGLNQSFSDGVENTTSPVYTSSQKVFNSSWMKATGELMQPNTAAHSSLYAADFWQRRGKGAKGKKQAQKDLYRILLVMSSKETIFFGISTYTEVWRQVGCISCCHLVVLLHNKVRRGESFPWYLSRIEQICNLTI